MFEQINRKKASLDTLRPLQKYTLKSLREKLLLEWTYHTNAIEGNTLTMNETKVVLEGITIGGKTMREHSILSWNCAALVQQKLQCFAPTHLL